MKSLPKQNFIYIQWNVSEWNYSINVCEFSKEKSLYNIGVIGWVDQEDLIEYLEINDLKIAKPNIEFLGESDFFNIDIFTNSKYYNEGINIRTKKEVIDIVLKNKGVYIPSYYETII